MYDITGDSKILELAKVFDRDYFLDNLESGKDVLNKLHANTHLPMIIAAMHRFDISGEEKYKTVALNFYKYLLGKTFVMETTAQKHLLLSKGEYPKRLNIGEVIRS